MLSMQCLILVGFNIISYAVGGSFYDTPQLDDQFANFRITNPTPRARSAAGGDIQDPVILDSYSVVFEFKGKGNALLLLQEDGTNETHNVCLVEIGGGELYRTIGVYKSKVPGESKVGGTAISYVTSEDEFRPFWIRWLNGRTNIYLGPGYEPGVSQFYGTGGALDFQVNALSISTSSANNGSWHFNIDEKTTSDSQTTFRTTTLEEDTSMVFKTSSNPSYSVATTVKLVTLRTTAAPIRHPSTFNAPKSKVSTLQTTPAISSSITYSNSSVANMSKSSTLQTTPKTSSYITYTSASSAITSKSSTKTSPSTTNPGTSWAAMSKSLSSPTTPTASSSPNTSRYTASEFSSTEFSSTTPVNIATITSRHTYEDSVSGFISQPTGILLTSVGAAALLTTGACVGRRMFTKGEGNKKKDVDVQSTNEDLEANESE